MEKELTLEEKYEIAINAIETFCEWYWYNIYADSDADADDYILDALEKIDHEKAKQIRAEQKQEAINNLGEGCINNID